jgi:hypothetical protein
VTGAGRIAFLQWALPRLGRRLRALAPGNAINPRQQA